MSNSQSQTEAAGTEPRDWIDKVRCVMSDAWVLGSVGGRVGVLRGRREDKHFSDKQNHRREIETKQAASRQQDKDGRVRGKGEWKKKGKRKIRGDKREKR